MFCVEPVPHNVTSLVHACIRKLAHVLIKYGPKRVRLGHLSMLPRSSLELLLQILVSKNALNDNVLPHALTRQTQRLCLEGSSQLRRCLLNTIGRSCPNLRLLDLSSCQQVDNRIVRDVLQNCEHLRTLRLEGCTKISDSAFAPALWKPPLVGLLGLRDLSIAKCGQVTFDGLMGYVMKGAPFLRTLGVASCRLMITDDVATELLYRFGLVSLDLSFCTQITDAPFQAPGRSMLRELHVTNAQIGDVAIEQFAKNAPSLEVLNAGWVTRLSDAGVLACIRACPLLRTLCVCNTQITDATFKAIQECQYLEVFDASWCVRTSPKALDALAEDGQQKSGNCGPPARGPRLRELKLDQVGAFYAGGNNTTDISALVPLGSPDLWKKGVRNQPSGSSPLPTLLLSRTVSEPPAMSLPPPAASAATSFAWPSSVYDDWLNPPSNALPPIALDEQTGFASEPREALALKGILVRTGHTLEVLTLEGVRVVSDSSVLHAIATGCPALRQLALTFAHALGAGSHDDDLCAGLRAVGDECRHLFRLNFDCTARSHRPLIDALALPGFLQLQSLTLCCCRAEGLRDSELEAVLSQRTKLETLELRNCEGLTDGLFPKWTGRESRDEARLVERLDEALLSSLMLGGALAPSPSFGISSAASPNQLRENTGTKPPRRRHNPKGSPAASLRSLANFSLSGATSLSDRSAEALAELLHDAQTVHLRGCPLLTEESLKSFRKICRHLRSVTIVARDKALSWNVATSGVKTYRNKRSGFHCSGSSGTESA